MPPVPQRRAQLSQPCCLLHHLLVGPKEKQHRGECKSHGTFEMRLGPPFKDWSNPSCRFPPPLTLITPPYLLVRSRPRWPCRCPTSLLQDQFQPSNIHIHTSLYPTATLQWKWTLWPVIIVLLFFCLLLLYIQNWDWISSMCLPEQWFLWTHWGRRTRRAWSCWSRQRIRVPTTATPWSLLATRAPPARSPQQPRYPSAHLHPTTLMVDWRRGGEEPAVSPSSCPTNHRTYRCPSVFKFDLILTL